MDTIGDRLRIARESAHDRLGRIHKITQNELSNEMGVTQSTVNKIENNRLKRGEIDVTKLMDAAKFLKASFLWLATGNGAMEQEDSKLLQDLEFQKGFPVYWPQDLTKASKTPQFYLNVAPLLHERLSKNAFFTLVNDDGMNPDIKMGDLVLVDPRGSLQVGSYVLARISGQKPPILRRIVEDENDGYLLKPLSSDFKTRELEKLDDLLGVAVEFRSFLLPSISYKSELGDGRPLNIINFQKG